MTGNLSIGTKFFLLSGQLLAGIKPQNWVSPTGEMIDGNKMFEEAFLLEVYRLLDKKVIVLSGQGKDLKIKKLKTPLPSSGFAEFIAENLPEEEMLFYKWVKDLSYKVAGANPARAMLALIEKEAQEFKKETKTRVLFFTFKSQDWDREKIANLAKNELETLKKTWQKAQTASWWEDSRQMLKHGLTLARIRKDEEDWERFEE